MSKLLKICPYCGKQVADGTKVCPACKRSLTLPAPVEKKKTTKTEAPVSTAKTTRKADKNSRRKISKAGIAILVISILILLAAIVVLTMVLMDGGLDGLSSDSTEISPVTIVSGTTSPAFSQPLEEEVGAPDTTIPSAEPADNAEDADNTTDDIDETDEADDANGLEYPEITDGNMVTSSSDTVYVRSDGVNIRSGPGTEYDTVGTVNAGDSLQRSGTTVNGWSRVEYDGTVGYIYSALVSTSEQSEEIVITDTDGFATVSDTIRVKADANVRMSPSTDGTIITVVKAGETLDRIGVGDNWSRINYNGITCYIHNNMITASTDSDGFTAVSDNVTVKADANIRTSPDLNSSVVTVATAGTVLSRTGISDSWSRVEYNGQVCYIHNNMLK